MKLLALDFDGVISDSAPEAFVVAVASYRDVWPGSRLPAVGAIDDAPALYRAFVEQMPLGNRAEDFAVVLRALEQDVALPDQPTYDAFFRTQDEAELLAFHEHFYEVRSAWAARDPEGWLDLMAPYPGFLEMLRRRRGDALLAIATAKDRASVERLLVRYGIEDLFPGERVLDKEAGRHKRAHLEALAGRHGLDPAELTFVDDKLNHLESVAGLGVRTALAAWGYNGPREHLAARRGGHLVLSLDDAEAILFGA